MSEQSEVYVIPTRGLSMDPIIEEMQPITVCKDSKKLSYANDMPAPCDWVESVYKWAETSDLAYYLNVYVTDIMMHIHVKYREGRVLKNKDLEIIKGVNEAIYACPRTNTEFIAVRGVYFDNYKPRIGQIVTYGIERSASFNIEEVLQGYISEDNDESGIMFVTVPSGSILAYHPSEDQVIFPIGARFLVISEIKKIKVSAFGKSEEISQYECIYIGAPEFPEVRPLNISVEVTENKEEKEEGEITYSGLFSDFLLNLAKKSSEKQGEVGKLLGDKDKWLILEKNENLTAKGLDIKKYIDKNYTPREIALLFTLFDLYQNAKVFSEPEWSTEGFKRGDAMIIPKNKTDIFVRFEHIMEKISNFEKSIVKDPKYLNVSIELVKLNLLDMSLLLDNILEDSENLENFLKKHSNFEEFYQELYDMIKKRRFFQWYLFTLIDEQYTGEVLIRLYEIADKKDRKYIALNAFYLALYGGDRLFDHYSKAFDYLLEQTIKVDNIFRLPKSKLWNKLSKMNTTLSKMLQGYGVGNEIEISDDKLIKQLKSSVENIDIGDFLSLVNRATSEQESILIDLLKVELHGEFERVLKKRLNM